MTQTLERIPTPTSVVEQPPPRHRVVVVGGGLRRPPGGAEATPRAGRRDPDRPPKLHLFQPLVYQVATGGLSPAEIAAPLRSVLRRQDNAKVVLGDVVGFDLDTKEVVLDQLADFELGGRIPFDSLIVAGGSQYSYFGHDEWQADAPELKSLTGALDIRSRILTAFEAAEVESDSKARRAALDVRSRGGRADRGRDGGPDRRARALYPAARLPGGGYAGGAGAARASRRPRAGAVSRVAVTQGNAGAREARSHSAGRSQRRDR